VVALWYKKSHKGSLDHSMALCFKEQPVRMERYQRMQRNAVIRVRWERKTGVCSLKGKRCRHRTV